MGSGTEVGGVGANKSTESARSVLGEGVTTSVGSFSVLVRAGLGFSSMPDGTGVSEPSSSFITLDERLVFGLPTLESSVARQQTCRIKSWQAQLIDVMKASSKSLRKPTSRNCVTI